VNIAYANYLTEDKNVDIELLVQIVASYLIGRQDGELDDDTPSPAVLFEESLFPTLRNGAMEAEVIKDEGPDTRAIEDLGSEQDTD
jgi:hypothetical protein